MPFKILALVKPAVADAKVDGVINRYFDKIFTARREAAGRPGSPVGSKHDLMAQFESYDYSPEFNHFLMDVHPELATELTTEEWIRVLQREDEELDRRLSRLPVAQWPREVGCSGVITPDGE